MSLLSKNAHSGRHIIRSHLRHWRGGGKIPRPGEVSLAHRGVLFLDELPEFRREAVEILRQPMEEHQVCISRMSGSFVYPANTMLVAAMNPCRCGYYPDGRCTCTEAEVHHYLGKVSQPILDRIDISIEAPEIGYEQLVSGRENESSESIRERVVRAHEVQKRRYAGTGIHFNADLSVEDIRKYCPLGKEENQMLESAFKKLRLSARAYHRIIKVSRTIADLEGSAGIRCSHIAEAICYRAAERKFWI